MFVVINMKVLIWHYKKYVCDVIYVCYTYTLPTHPPTPPAPHPHLPQKKMGKCITCIHKHWVNNIIKT